MNAKVFEVTTPPSSITAVLRALDGKSTDGGAVRQLTPVKLLAVLHVHTASRYLSSTMVNLYSNYTKTHLLSVRTSIYFPM